MPKLNFQIDIQKTDTFLVSYPKSGNTWARFLIANLLSQKLKSFDETNSVIPDIHDLKSLAYLKPGENRILKSHFSFQPSYPKVIYLVRDPRSVCVSQYFFKLRRNEISKDLDFSDFFNQFLNGFNEGFGSWGEHVGSWIGAKEKSQNFLLIKYEDLKENPFLVLFKIVKFLKLDVTKEIVNTAIENSSMDKMRKIELETKLGVSDKKINESIPFIRKGSTTEWKEFLTDDMEERLRSAFYFPMEKLKYL